MLWRALSKGHFCACAFGSWFVWWPDWQRCLLSLRRYQPIANDFLDGALKPYPITNFSAVRMLINGAYRGGFPNGSCDAHLELAAIAASRPSHLAAAVARAGVCRTARSRKSLKACPA